MIRGEKETAPRPSPSASLSSRHRKQLLCQKTQIKGGGELMHSLWVAPVRFQVPKKAKCAKTSTVKSVPQRYKKGAAVINRLLKLDLDQRRPGAA
jgi:hypothetical protein